MYIDVVPYQIFKDGDEILINNIWHKMEPKELVEQSWAGEGTRVRRPFRPDLPLNIRRGFYESVKGKKCDTCYRPVMHHVTLRGAHVGYYCEECYGMMGTI
jgi:hypothetical protein